VLVSSKGGDTSNVLELSNKEGDTSNVLELSNKEDDTCNVLELTNFLFLSFFSFMDKLFFPTT